MLDVVDVLLKYKADPNAQNKVMKTLQVKQPQWYYDKLYSFTTLLKMGILCFISYV